MRTNIGVILVGLGLATGSVAAITPTQGYHVGLAIVGMALAVGIAGTFAATRAYSMQLERLMQRYRTYPENRAARAEAHAMLAELPTEELVRFLKRHDIETTEIERRLRDPDRQAERVLDEVLDRLRSR